MAWYNQRSDFQIQEFYRAIKKLGYFVSWSKAGKCPCIPEEKQAQPDFNCPLCRGKGWYWFDTQTIQGIMTNFNEQLKYNQTGEIAAGTSYFTTLPQYKLNFWDRLENLHSKIRYTEVLTKGNHGEKDRFRFKPIDIINCRTVKSIYDKKTDFTLDTDAAEIDWTPTGREPNTGERYSVEYFIHPSWIVTNIFPIRDTFVKSKKPSVTFTELPIKVEVRLEYFVF